MSLEQLKELFQNGNVTLKGLEDKKKLGGFLEKIKEVKKYGVTESYFGVAHSEEKIYNLPEILGLVKNNPDTDYILAPIQ